MVKVERCFNATASRPGVLRIIGSHHDRNMSSGHNKVHKQVKLITLAIIKDETVRRPIAKKLKSLRFHMFTEMFYNLQC